MQFIESKQCSCAESKLIVSRPLYLSNSWGCVITGTSRKSTKKYFLSPYLRVVLTNVMILARLMVILQKTSSSICTTCYCIPFDLQFFSSFSSTRLVFSFQNNLRKVPLYKCKIWKSSDSKSWFFPKQYKAEKCLLFTVRPGLSLFSTFQLSPYFEPSHHLAKYLLCPFFPSLRDQVGSVNCYRTVQATALKLRHLLFCGF